MVQKKKAKEIVDQMHENDAFSKWLGIQICEINAGSCILKMKVRNEMLNGFHIAHGGITYSLADSALAFASNGHGRQSVSIETSISHLLPTKEGDLLIAQANEIHCSNKVGIYDIRIENQDKQLVALFKGTVYRTSKHW